MENYEGVRDADRDTLKGVSAFAIHKEAFEIIMD